MQRWKRLRRRIIYKTKFVSIFEDTVELPNNKLINDFSIMQFPNSVVIVATDENDKFLLMNEYKYAMDKEILTFPAGGIEKDQIPLEAAARELLEETGYSSDDIEIVGRSMDYPSKVRHMDYIVRARNAKKVQDVMHEATESIGDVQLITPDDMRVLWHDGKIDSAYMIAALAYTFPDVFRKID